MDKKTHGFKRASKDFDAKGLLISTIKVIQDSDPEIFQTLKNDYEALDKSSDAYEKAALSIFNSVLVHKRIYFAMSGRSLKTLMLTNPNIPDVLKTAFSPNTYARILSFLYNEANLIKLVKHGAARKASVYEVVHPALVEYLKPKVDAEKQLAETLKFCQSKKR